MWLNPRETMDLVTFTEEILNEKRIFCAVARRNKSETYFIILKQSPHSKAKGFLGFHNCAIAQFHKNISIIFFFFSICCIKQPQFTIFKSIRSQAFFKLGVLNISQYSLESNFVGVSS